MAMSTDDAQSDSDRNKCYMVIAALEKELGKYITSREANIDNLPAGLVDDINQRSRATTAQRGPRSVRDTVAETYLKQLFDVVEKVENGTEAMKHVRLLRDLCEVLNLYLIRNATAHPNRPFFGCFWHRVAAIATDPAIDILGLHGVRDAFQKASAGLIEMPPEGWLSRVNNVVPNTLPARFAHEITGLVGRDREARQVREYLANPRVATLVVTGPGGVGKTALVLDILQELCKTPAFAETADAVCFVSCKTEQLTHKGVQKLSAAERIVDVKETLTVQISTIFDDEKLSNFDECARCYGDRRLVIFLDNLETLIRDNREDLQAFHLNLPVTWRLVLTSRVAVDSSTVLPIDVLKMTAAEHLCRTYAARSGAGTLPPEVISKIASQSGQNPLAIRLSVDLYRVGGALPQALSDARREVIAFSFTNLIEALTEGAVRVLECLFVKDSIGRAEIADILSESSDGIAEAIAELSQTSLIVRDNSEEREVYSLTPAVRELLLTHTPNLSLRGNIVSILNQRRVQERQIDESQTKKNTGIWDSWYIPPSAPQPVKIECATAISALKSSRKDGQALAQVLGSLKNLAIEYPREEAVQRFMGHLLNQLSDKDSALKAFREAANLSPDNPGVLHSMANLHFSHYDYAEAAAIYKKLLEEGWGDDHRSDCDFAHSVDKGYLLSLLFDGQIEELLESTKDWKDKGTRRALWGVARASAWKRKVEKYGPRDAAKVIECLHSAIAICDDVFRNNGYTKDAVKEALKIIEDIHFRCSRQDSVFYAEGIQEWLEFSDKHLLQISDDNPEMRKRAIAAIEKLAGLDLPDNPFRRPKWNGYLQSINSPEVEGMEVATVSYIHHNFEFLFANNKNNESIYVNYKSVRGASWKDWTQLQQGSTIFVKVGQRREDGKAVPSDLTLLRHPPRF